MQLELWHPSFQKWPDKRFGESVDLSHVPARHVSYEAALKHHLQARHEEPGVDRGFIPIPGAPVPLKGV